MTELEATNYDPATVERLLVNAQLTRSGAPLRHVDRTDLLRAGIGHAWAAAMEKAESVCRRPGSIVALLGPRGCGKTQIAVELLRSAVRRRCRVRYGRLSDFAAAMRDASRDGGGERQALASWTRPELLALDETQDSSGSEFERRILTTLVDSRYADNRRTILVGNFDAYGFAAFAGDSVTSRLNEVGEILELRGPSFRENPEGGRA